MVGSRVGRLCEKGTEEPDPPRENIKRCARSKDPISDLVGGSARFPQRQRVISVDEFHSLPGQRLPVVVNFSRPLPGRTSFVSYEQVRTSSLKCEGRNHPRSRGGEVEGLVVFVGLGVVCLGRFFLRVEGAEVAHLAVDLEMGHPLAALLVPANARVLARRRTFTRISKTDPTEYHQLFVSEVGVVGDYFFLAWGGVGEGGHLCLKREVIYILQFSNALNQGLQPNAPPGDRFGTFLGTYGC